MKENQENNVLIGVILGSLSVVGVIAGIYFMRKNKVIDKLKDKYYDWKDTE